MSDVAAPDEHATPEKIEETRADLEFYNNERKKDKLRRGIVRAHEWRIQVWAQSELKIRSSEAALAALGGESPDLFEPQFDDDEMLHHYASMRLSK